MVTEAYSTTMSTVVEPRVDSTSFIQQTELRVKRTSLFFDVMRFVHGASSRVREPQAVSIRVVEDDGDTVVIHKNNKYGPSSKLLT